MDEIINGNFGDISIESLMQNGSFDVSKQSFYYADTNKNYTSGQFKDKVNTFESNQKLIDEASTLNGGIVKINIASDSKIYYANANENSEESINKAKLEGYDLVAVNSDNGYDYVILNNEKITERKYMSIEEARKEFNELEKQYNVAMSQIMQLLMGNQASNNSSDYSQYRGSREYSDEQKAEINKILKQYGIIENDYELSEHSDIQNAIQQIDSIGDEFRVDIGYLENAISRLDSVDMTFYNDLTDAQSAINSLGIDITNTNYLNEALEYINSNLKDVNNGSGKIDSYLNRLNQLKKTLSLNNSNYEIEKYRSNIQNIEEFGDDLNLTELEKRNMVYENTESLIKIIRPQLEKKSLLDRAIVHDNYVTYDDNIELDAEYLTQLYEYANKVSDYYDNKVLSGIYTKKINGEQVSEQEFAFAAQSDSDTTFNLLAQLQYTADCKLSKAEQEWYNSKKADNKYSEIDKEYLYIGVSNIATKLMNDESISSSEQTFFDENREGYDLFCDQRMDNANQAFDELDKDVSSGKNTTIKKVVINDNKLHVDCSYFVYYENQDGKYVTEEEYNKEQQRVNLANRGKNKTSRLVAFEETKQRDELVELEQPTIREVKIASAFDMLDEKK